MSARKRPKGVLAMGWASVESIRHPAAIHIGPNPTFAEAARKIEVHLLEFQGDLYDRVMHVDVVDRVRDVRRFALVEELQSQLQQDIQTVRAIIAN